MDRNDLEVMAPAGSWDALAAALNAGANSVYFGVGKLNMRALATGTFQVEDLDRIATLCHESGAKAYLTLNTVIYDEDHEEMVRVIAAAKSAGIDALIISDVAAMVEARRQGVEVHLSTQLNISNVEALRFYAQFADVAVLARECSLEQVRRIHEAIERDPIVGPSGKPIRIEMFSHGAMCMAVSGKCALSLLTRGKSANRGECLQTCRRAYVVRDEDREIELEMNNGYIMSPKDLKTIDFLDRLVEAGVRVFKIEGRARSPEYVYETVSSYREALDRIAQGRWQDTTKHDWDERLGRVFNRGFWSGYYLGAKTIELSEGYGSQATETKVFIGECINYFAKPKVGEFRMMAGGFNLGDKLLVTGPTTGAVYVTPEKVLEEGQEKTTIVKGESVTFSLPQKARLHDKLYRIVKR